MSTLVIDTIQGKTTAGSVNVRGEGSNNTNLQQGLAKSWCVFNGTSTVAITDSHNSASLTDVATGDYTLGFVSNMASVNYAVSGSSVGSSAANYTICYVEMVLIIQLVYTKLILFIGLTLQVK